MDESLRLVIDHHASDLLLSTLSDEYINAVQTLSKYAEAAGRPRLRVIDLVIDTIQSKTIQTSARVHAQTCSDGETASGPRGDVSPLEVSTLQRTSAKFDKCKLGGLSGPGSVLVDADAAHTSISINSKPSSTVEFEEFTAKACYPGVSDQQV